MFGFNLSERYVVVLNFLLVGTIVYFLANSLIDVMNLRIADNVVPAETASVSPDHVRAGATLSRSSYESIIQRDIFNVVPAPAAAPAETEEDLQIKLLGTSHLTIGKPFVIVEDSSGSQSLYRLGDTIPNVGRLLAVGQDRAVVLHKGHRVALTIPRDDDQGAAALAATPLSRRPPFVNNPILRRFGHPGFRGFSRMPERPGAGVHRLGANRYVLDRSTVDSNLQNMPRLFTEIRAIPILQHGASNGFRLSEIESGSIFQQIGLRDGDVLTSVGGQPINDPTKALAVLAALRTSSSITLSVMRNGAPMQLYYNIR